MDNGGEVMRGEAMKFNVELTGESVWDETVQLWLTGAPTRVFHSVPSVPPTHNIMCLGQTGASAYGTV
jgi:hypothetical protein